MSVFRKFAVWAVTAALVICSVAQAHFIWIVVEGDGQKPGVFRLFFGDGTEPSEAELLDRVAHSKAFAVNAQGERVALTLAKKTEGDEGEWQSAVADPACQVAEAECAYGTFSRGEKTTLLHYSAKYVRATPAALAIARSKGFALDVVPHVKDGAGELEVLWNGQPATAATIVIYTPDGTKQEPTGTEGRFPLGKLATGRYTIRAKVSEEKAGKTEDGKAYDLRSNYTTLVLDVPAADKAQARVEAQGEAETLLAAARAKRCVWKNFPGFKAEISIVADGQAAKGTLSVSADGTVQLDGIDEAIAQKVLPNLRSMVGHRLADSEDGAKGAVFADDGQAHPMGRLIKLDDIHSSYRVADNVIRQVNRKSETGSFTISVVDVYQSPDGKNLPKLYTVSFWNTDGSLKMSNTIRDEWTRVGDFDLPTLHFRVGCGQDRCETLEIRFAKHELLTAK